MFAVLLTQINPEVTLVTVFCEKGIKRACQSICISLVLYRKDIWIFIENYNFLEQYNR